MSRAASPDRPHLDADALYGIRPVHVYRFKLFVVDNYLGILENISRGFEKIPKIAAFIALHLEE